MVFVSRGRGRGGGGRGRRGVGEVVFQSPPGHGGDGHTSSRGHGERHDDGRSRGGDSRQHSAETLRITVGNDKFRERSEEGVSGRLSPSVSQRLGPPVESYSRDRDSLYKQEDEQYRLEAKAYGGDSSGRGDTPGRYDREAGRDQGFDNRNPYRSRDSRDSDRPAQREYGDRRGFGAGAYPPSSSAGPSLFPSAPRSSVAAEEAALATRPPNMPSFPSAPQAGAGPNPVARPLKSILKRKPDPVASEKTEKPSGLPGISNYMDDIDDEEKFLYGEDDGVSRDTSVREADNRAPAGQDIRSAAKSWQPSVPEKSVSSFVSAQREISEKLQRQSQPHDSQYGQGNVAPASQSGPPQQQGDLWSMLAKSVETVQQQQQQQQGPPVTGAYSYQTPVSQPPLSVPPPTAVLPPTQPGAAPTTPGGGPATGYDPTIENILKSIGFDFDMSKRMQEKAKQGGGEPPAKQPGAEETQYGVGGMSSFIGSDMSHEDMRSKLGPADTRPRDERDCQGSFDRTRPDDMGMGGHIERDRGERNSRDMFSDSPVRNELDRLQRDCSPVSADGSPPPPMFNLPPIKIKRKTSLERNRSPGWERSFRSKSKSPSESSSIVRKRDGSRDNRDRSRSPSWSRSVNSASRRHSRSPVRRGSPVHSRQRSPSSTRRSSPGVGRQRSPPGRARSPIIKRTFNISPKFNRRTPSPRRRSRSPSGPHRGSPGRRGTKSPLGRRQSSSDKRGSRSPRRRSRSPFRRNSGPLRRSRSPIRRSRSPVRRSRSPVRRRSRSPVGRGRSPLNRNRRRSPSPRGRKRIYSPRTSRSRSRERKMRRSTSRDRRSRSGSGPRGRRSRGSSSGSDSDVDAPANRQYFSSPLRLNSRNPRFNRPYDASGPPQMPPQGPLPPGMPPFGMPPSGPMVYGPGFPPPPGMPPPFGMPPSGPMVYGMPPPGPGMPPPGPGMPPPVSVNYTPPVSDYYNYPPPPTTVTAPMAPTMSPSMAPPGTIDVQMPLNLPNRPHQDTNRPNQDTYINSTDADDKWKRERSNSMEKERIDSKSNSSSNSNRTVLPPKPRVRTIGDELEDEKSSRKSTERTIIVGGRAKVPKTREEGTDKPTKKPEISEKEKAKIVKEKESMVIKMKALQNELNTLKNQETDLKKAKKDRKQDPILEENMKLSDEIKKELGKMKESLREFFKKNAGVLEQEQKKRTIQLTPKKEPEIKREAKRDHHEFKIEKGKLMKHQFVDEGKHWCKGCKNMYTNIHDYVQHLSSYKHKQQVPAGHKPWRELVQANDGMIVNKNGIRVPLPGIEFVQPVTAYFCELCKVFLGDVSCTSDHFRCESHYLNYQRYCKENPFYDKKYREDKEAFISGKTEVKTDVKDVKEEPVTPPVDRKSDSAISKLTRSGVRDQEKKKKKEIETDSRIREKEKKWEKDVDELDDVKTDAMNQDRSKEKIKLNLKSQKETEDAKKTTDGESQDNEPDADNAAKTDDNAEKMDTCEKGKIAINVHLAGKNIIGKGTVQKKNPLLPPWQPVGKKIDTRVTKYTHTAPNLDEFLTSEGGKIPVVNETSQKKKIDPKELLEAFKIKKKEEAERAKEEAIKEAERLAEELAEQKLAEEDMKMMGIDPESEKPLAEKRPPPPVSQNIPLPEETSTSTTSQVDVHNEPESKEPKQSAGDDVPQLSSDTKAPFAGMGDIESIPLPPPTPSSATIPLPPPINSSATIPLPPPIDSSATIPLPPPIDSSATIPLPPPIPCSATSSKSVKHKKKEEVLKGKESNNDTDSKHEKKSEEPKVKKTDKISGIEHDKVHEPKDKESDKVTDFKHDEGKEPNVEEVSDIEPNKVEEPKDKESDKTANINREKGKKTKGRKSSRFTDRKLEEKVEEPKVQESDKTTDAKGMEGKESNVNESANISDIEHKEVAEPKDKESGETTVDKDVESQVKASNSISDIEPKKAEEPKDKEIDETTDAKRAKGKKTKGRKSDKITASKHEENVVGSKVMESDKISDPKSEKTENVSDVKDSEKLADNLNEKKEEEPTTKELEKISDSADNDMNSTEKTNDNCTEKAVENTAVKTVENSTTESVKGPSDNKNLEKIDKSEEKETPTYTTLTENNQDDESSLDKTEDISIENEDDEVPVQTKGRRSTSKRGGRGRGRGRGRAAATSTTRATPKKTAAKSTTPRRSTRSAIAAAVEEIDNLIKATEEDKQDTTIESQGSSITDPESHEESTSKAEGKKVKKSRQNAKTEDAEESKEPKSSDSAVAEDSETENDNKTDSLPDKKVEVNDQKPKSRKRNSSTPRRRKTSTSLEKMECEAASSDIDDTASEASGVSMHMGSDFEVVDDLDDMEVVDEAV